VSTSRDEVREGLSSVTRGTLFLLVAALVYVGLSFASRVIVVRNLSTGEYSAYALALTLTGVIAAIGSLGLPNAIARSLPYTSQDADRRAMVRGTMLIGSAAGLAGSVTLFLLAGAIGHALGTSSPTPQQITLAMQLFSITIATSVISTLIASIFQGYEDVLPNALFVQIVFPALFLVFLIALFVDTPSGLSYFEVLVAYAASNVVALGALALYAVRKLPRRLPPGPRNPAALRRLLTFASPLLVVGIMNTLTGSGDTLVLGIYHSGELASYSASLTLARLLQVGVTAASYIFLPVATRFLRRADNASVELTFTTVTKWMIVFSLPLFLLFFFLPSESLLFVYKPPYGAVTLPLDILVLGAFATTLLGPGPSVQVANGRTRLLAYNAIIAGFIDLGVAFALVPTYGYVGAAIAWASANAAYSLLSIVELGTLDGIHPFRGHFVIPLVATAVPVGLLLGLYRVPLPLWSLPPLGLGIAALFVLLVLITRSVDVGDAMLMDAVERMLGTPLPRLRRLGRLGLRRSGP